MTDVVRCPSCGNIVSRLPGNLIAFCGCGARVRIYADGSAALEEGDGENRFEIKGHEVLNRTVKPHAAKTGYIYLPQAWVGARVAVVRITNTQPQGNGTSSEKKEE